jgi:hypothetical protein
MWGVLTPAIELWTFESLGGLPSPHFGSVSLIFTLFQSRVATIGNTLTMRRLGQQWPKEWQEDPKTKAIVWSLPQLKEPNVND